MLTSTENPAKAAVNNMSFSWSKQRVFADYIKLGKPLCQNPSHCWLLTLTGGDASGAAEGPDAGDRFSANRPGLHQVHTEAVHFALQLGAELHQRNGVEILRHERVCFGTTNEVSAGRGRHVVGYTPPLTRI